MEKFKITKIEKECFFLKLGAIIYIDFITNRVYSEDKEQYMPLSILEQCKVDGAQVKEHD